MAFAAAGSYRTLSKTVRLGLDDRARGLARETALQVDSWLAVRKAEIAALALNPAVRSLQWEQAEPHLQLSLDSMPEFEQFSLTHLDGSARVTQTMGAEIAPRGIPPLEYWQPAMRGNVYVSYPSRTTGGEVWRVAIAAPVWSWPPLNHAEFRSPEHLQTRQISLERLQMEQVDPAQAPYPAGVLAGSVSFRRLADTLNPDLMGQFSSLLLLHPQQPSLALTATPAGIAAEGIAVDRSGSQLEAIAASAIDGSVQLLRRKGEPAVYIVSASLEEAPNWSLAIAIPQTEFERPLRELEWLAGWMGLAVFASVALLARSIWTQRQALKQERELSELHRHLLEKGQQLAALQQTTIETVSHQMEGPLSTLQQGLALMRDFGEAARKEQKRHYLDAMQQAVRRLGLTLDRIVSLRNAECQLELHPAPVDLPQLCVDLIEDCTAASQRTIELNFRGPCGTVYLDSHLVALTLRPILLNAIKYSTAHPELLPIQFDVDCRCAERIQFIVRDMGIGIPENEMHSICEPFVRGSNAISTPGAGMGLAIAKRAIALQNGELSIYSQYGQGTSFTVSIPIIARSISETRPISRANGE
ncbi:HAMP domain-containing sensor histidine kinase [Synechococcus sp. PCC 7336]|uniref:sensor histidine kinase n=1 Tax=Synechococcus sp. PCC 7336 TaxID=195250 RepID=UPI000373863C|nr:HAMP domain-containing sensor histidine kinase [Synechococcus sp. PCC 7336]